MKTRTQKELGRKSWVLDQVLADNKANDISNDDQLTTLEAVPEHFINSIYEVSYDEMTEEEIAESINYIKDRLNETI